MLKMFDKNSDATNVFTVCSETQQNTPEENYFCHLRIRHQASLVSTVLAERFQGRAVGEALVRMDSETSAELSAKLRSGLPFCGRKTPIAVQLTQCSLADVVSAFEPSMAVHGVAAAPLEPATRGVLFTPWEYSNQVHHHSLVSTSHHQMIKTGECQSQEYLDFGDTAGCG